jgi:hypothetical protein
MSRQKPFSSAEPGKSALTPTTAMGTLLVRRLLTRIPPREKGETPSFPLFERGMKGV